MSRKEPFPYSHSVARTRCEHKCERCGQVISIGSRARYKNLFTGRRGHIHELPTSCSIKTDKAPPIVGGGVKGIGLFGNGHPRGGVPRAEANGLARA